MRCKASIFIKFLNDNNAYDNFKNELIRHGLLNFFSEEINNDENKLVEYWVKNCTIDKLLIRGAFNLKKTIHGYMYWYNINNKWIDYIDSIKKNKNKTNKI